MVTRLMLATMVDETEFDLGPSKQSPTIRTNRSWGRLSNFSGSFSSESRHACAVSGCWDDGISLWETRSAGWMVCPLIQLQHTCAHLIVLVCALDLQSTLLTYRFKLSRATDSNVYDCLYLDVHKQLACNAKPSTSSGPRWVSPWQKKCAPSLR